MSGLQNADVATQKSDVATLVLKNLESPENCYFGLFSSPFSPEDYKYSFLFFREKRNEVGEHLS